MRRFFTVARQWERVPKKAAVETVSDMSHSFGLVRHRNAGAVHEQL
jgi:hypothetical protein